MRFVAANLQPDQDTITVFRCCNKVGFAAAFADPAAGLRERFVALQHGIDRRHQDRRHASKISSVRYDRAKGFRAKLASDIADLTARAEGADAKDIDPQALPVELARQEALKTEHEYRRAYNAQAVVCADGSQLVLATNLVATTADCPKFRGPHPGRWRRPSYYRRSCSPTLVTQAVPLMS